MIHSEVATLRRCYKLECYLVGMVIYILIHAVANLSSCWFVTSICLSASKWLEQCQGSLTAAICLDLVIDEQRPFSAPNS